MLYRWLCLENMNRRPWVRIPLKAGWARSYKESFPRKFTLPLFKASDWLLIIFQPISLLQTSVVANEIQLNQLKRLEKANKNAINENKSRTLKLIRSLISSWKLVCSDNVTQSSNTNASRCGQSKQESTEHKVIDCSWSALFNWLVLILPP